MAMPDQWTEIAYVAISDEDGNQYQFGTITDTIDISWGARDIESIATISAGRVTKFMVQLEVKHKGNWKQVLRYDCAHGYGHRDCYNIKGKHIKDELYLSFEDALTLADDDIDDNWESYKNRFLEGALP